MMALIWHEDAEVELSQAALYYEERGEGLGDRFLDEIDAVVARFQVAPEAPRIFDKGCRKARLERFPYAVIYRVMEDSIQIIAVMHSSRKPGYWHSREV
jgi:plasmid stabilization system protein ParE